MPQRNAFKLPYFCSKEISINSNFCGFFISCNFIFLPNEYEKNCNFGVFFQTINFSANLLFRKSEAIYNKKKIYLHGTAFIENRFACQTLFRQQFLHQQKEKKSICFANYNINFFKQKNFMHIALVFVLSKSVFNQVVQQILCIINICVLSAKYSYLLELYISLLTNFF